MKKSTPTVVLVAAVAAILWFFSSTEQKSNLRTVDASSLSRRVPPFLKRLEPASKRTPSAVESLEAKGSGNAETKSDWQTTPMIELLEADRFCDVVKKMGAGAPAIDIAVEAFRASRNLGRAADELLRPDGPLLGKDNSEILLEKQKGNGPGFALFTALRSADLVEGRTESTPDFESARKQLLDLETRDPSNAAYGFFRLYVEKKLGASDEELAGIAEAVSQKSTFDVYLSATLREIQVLSWTNPSYRMVGGIALGGMPVPDFFRPSTIIRELPVGLVSKEAIVRIGQLLMREGLEAQRGFQSYEWIPVQYQNGLGLLKRLAPEVAGQYLDFTQLSQQREGKEFYYEMMSEPWTFSDRCDRTEFDQFFYSHRYTY